MPGRDTASLSRIEVARAVLAVHDELRHVEAIGDEFAVGADDLPVDALGWLAWHQEQYLPAFRAWQAAMDELRLVLGEEFPGTHPWCFRPVCERITAAGGGS